MINGIICKVFKKQKVTANDVAGTIVSMFSIGGLICALSLFFGEAYLSSSDPTYVSGWSSILPALRVGLVGFGTTIVVVGIFVYSLMKFLDLINWVSERLTNITVAECPAYKKKP